MALTARMSTPLDGLQGYSLNNTQQSFGSGLPIYTDSSGGGGGSGGGTYSAPADPYAKWGGQAGYNQAVADYGTQKNSALGSIDSRINDEGTKYGSTIQDFLDSTGASQRKIDSQTIQNELAKRQGTAGVLDMIGHGLRSGGVILANKNASTSSAGDALARAWGDIGRREQSGVGNQYEQGKSGIGDAQNELQLQEQQGVRHLGENKTEVINSIVSDAQTAIAGLNQSAANASLPDRIDIEAKKQEIRNTAMAKLQAYDATLNNGVAGIKPIDNMAAKSKAASLDTAGTAADNPFNFTTNVSQQFDNTGPFASELPIFTFPSSKKADVATAGA